MHEGTPVPSLQWVELEEFIDLMDDLIPEDIYNACTQ